MNRLYPIGIQTFEVIRKEGYCYKVGVNFNNRIRNIEKWLVKM